MVFRSPRSPPRSPRSRPPRSLSQEIHDELMATELAEAQQADLELMTLGEVMGPVTGGYPATRKHRKNGWENSHVFMGKFTIDGDFP